MRTNPGDAGSGGAADNGPATPGVTGSGAAADAAAVDGVVGGAAEDDSNAAPNSVAGNNDTKDAGGGADGAVTGIANSRDTIGDAAANDDVASAADSGDTAEGATDNVAAADDDNADGPAGSSDDGEAPEDTAAANDIADVDEAAGDGDTAAADGEVPEDIATASDTAAGDDAEAAAVEVVDGVSREALGRARRARILQQFTDSELLLAAHDFAAVNPGDGFNHPDPLADRSIQLAGDGATGVSESGITWFASSVGLREDAAATLLGDALELSQRLPRVWKQFHDEGLPAFKARRVAWHTKKLSPTAAAHVDRMVAPSVVSMSLSRIKYFVEEARELYDTTDEPEIGSDWGITSTPNMEVTYPDGSQEICLRADKPDLDQFTHTLGTLTDLLAVRGDGRCRGARTSTALGLLANPHTALTWLQNRPSVPAARGTRGACRARSGSNDHSGAAGRAGATEALANSDGESTAQAKVFTPASPAGGSRAGDAGVTGTGGAGTVCGQATVGVTRAMDIAEATGTTGTADAAGEAGAATATSTAAAGAGIRVAGRGFSGVGTSDVGGAADTAKPATATADTDTDTASVTIAADAAADSAVVEPAFAGQTFGGLVQLVLHAQATGKGPVRVQGPKGGNLGLVAPEVVDRWLTRFTGKLTVTPVIDHDAWFQAEGYQPPPRLREHIQQRDQTCVFPDCTVPAVRCDIDHIAPYPQGATSTTNLAALCRHHHRIKTHHDWTYQRLPDGAYLWHGPDGQRALRDPTTGTTHLPPLPQPRSRPTPRTHRRQ